MKPSDFLTELSNDKLTQYKTAAAADASKADKEGDFKKGDKRFSGIVKATKKQFDNDAKKDVAEGSETAADIDKKIEFHKQGQAAAQYKGSMNKMHAAKIRELEAKKQVLKQGVAENVAGDVNSKKRYHFLYPHVPLDMHTDHEYNDLSDRDLQAVKSHQRELADKLGKPGAEEQSDIASHIQINRARSQYDQEQAHRRKVLDAEKIKRQARDAKRQQGVAEGTEFEDAYDKGYSDGYDGKGYNSPFPVGSDQDDEYEDGYSSGRLDYNKMNQDLDEQGVAEGLDKQALQKELMIINKLIKDMKNSWQQQHLLQKKQELLKQLKQGVAEGSEQKMSVQDTLAYLKKVMGTESHEDWRNHIINTNEYFVLKDISVNSLKSDLSGLNKTNVEKYKQMDFSKAPPIVIGSDGNILDGYHRANVAKALKVPTLKAWVGVKKQGVAEEKCPHCNGPMVSEELINEKKDACYYKVKSRYKVWPSAYASGALVKCRKKGADSWGNGGKKNESSILEGIEQADESLHDWFNKEKWVRMDTKGNIKGPCAKEPGEGKPKCLPQAKAHSLGKKGRASAAARKRREDPNPDRSGKAINVNTKKTKG